MARAKARAVVPAAAQETAQDLEAAKQVLASAIAAARSIEGADNAVMKILEDRLLKLPRDSFSVDGALSDLENLAKQRTTKAAS